MDYMTELAVAFLDSPVFKAWSDGRPALPPAHAALVAQIVRAARERQHALDSPRRRALMAALDGHGDRGPAFVPDDDLSEELVAAALYATPASAVALVTGLNIPAPTFIVELAEHVHELIHQTATRLHALVHRVRPGQLCDVNELRRAIVSELHTPLKVLDVRDLVLGFLQRPNLVQYVAETTHAAVPFATALAQELDHIDGMRLSRTLAVPSGGASREPDGIERFALVVRKIVEEQHASSEGQP